MKQKPQLRSTGRPEEGALASWDIAEPGKKWSQGPTFPDEDPVDGKRWVLFPAASCLPSPPHKSLLPWPFGGA